MQQIWARLQLLFAHGVATLIGPDRVQAKVLDGEVLDNLARVEMYGFSYRPKPGAQAYLLFPGGDRSYGVAILIGDKRYQMDLQEGEVAIHDDELGHSIKLGRDGIVIEGGGHDLIINNTPTVKIAGALEVGNGVTITGGLDVNGKDVSDAHTHNSSTPGTPTSAVN
ncbi:phage baseplate assembly protein domain-containing protein [Methylomonas sp. BW4-1]|uniref:phage baseplate assembly protein domain-containing protein n=1 Tax=unclassified Methylomonas TaxID=2608980 RepID=UPI001967BBB9|nr:phage baseplate assembly protein [Methylomonas sp. EFPC1]QSB03463.1 phage baseplate assembly protein [Methylomonas sp. EFPC1]